jgi:hypothetical protein
MTRGRGVGHHHRVRAEDVGTGVVVFLDYFYKKLGPRALFLLFIECFSLVFKGVARRQKT